MKKFLFLCTLIVEIVASQFSVSNIVFAANLNQKIAVVIVCADPDFQGKRFTKRITDYIGKKMKNVTILAGKEIQTKYEDYWFENTDDVVNNGTNPSREDLIKFVSYGNYDKVLYLVIPTPGVEHSVSGAMGGGTTTPVGTAGTSVNSGSTAYFNNYDAIITVNALLVDKNEIIKRLSSTNRNSGWMSNVTPEFAKEVAFKKCVKELSENINPLLKN